MRFRRGMSKSVDNKDKDILLVGFFVLLFTAFTDARGSWTIRACRNETLTMRCLRGWGIGVKNAQFGSSNAAFCQEKGEIESHCPTQSFTNYLRAKCQYKKTCSIKHDESLSLEDPSCPIISKYLEVEYTCCLLDRILIPVIVCDQPSTINCTRNPTDEIKIHDVIYGRGPCPLPNKKSNKLFGNDTLASNVSKQCDGKQTCLVRKPDNKYLEVRYACV